MRETRTALLEAGVEILTSETSDIESLKMQRVVKEAGLTSGAFYRHWDSLVAYHADLLRYAFTERRAVHSADIRRDILDELLAPSGSLPPILDLVRRHASRDHANLAADPAFRLWLTLWARQSTNPEAASVIGDGYRQVDERWCDLYSMILRRYGMELRYPFDERRLSTVFTALLEGLVVRSQVDPDAVPASLSDPTRPDEVWDLFGATIAAMLPVMTKRVDDHDDATVFQVADGMLAPREATRTSS